MPAGGRRKPPRLTLQPKKTATRSQNDITYGSGGINNLPSKREWEREMHQAAKVVVDGVVFNKNDDVLLRSHDGNENPWLGRIVKIQSRLNGEDEKDEVFALIRWYYSATDLAKLENLVGFDPLCMPRNERTMSHALDIQPVETLEEVVQVIPYDETRLEQPRLIDEHTFFQRGNLSLLQTRLTYEPTNHPEPMGMLLGELTCVCHKLYNPFPNYVGPPNPDPDGGVMRFCPRPSCRGRWFHQSCLLETDPPCVITGPDAFWNRSLRLLANDPDCDWPDPHQPDLYSGHSALYTFIDARRTHGKSSMHANELTLIHGLQRVRDSKNMGPSQLPAAVIRAAGQSITRRPDNGNLSLAGNLEDVILARRLVFQDLEGGHAVLEKVEEWLGEDGSGWSDAGIYTGIWAALSNERMLASPLRQYWENLRMDEYTLDLFCPTCRGAI